MKKLASYEAPFVGQVIVKGKPIDAVAELKALLARGDRGGAVAFFMVKVVGGPAFLPLMMKLMPKVWRQLQGVAHTLPYDTELMRGFVVPIATLKKITVPTLVMGGGKAKPNMVAAVQGVADAIPGSVHRTLPRQTHQVKDEAIAPELIAFFV
jgi:pimeloyl-ACP methyl ester carboxylesterase